MKAELIWMDKMIISYHFLLDTGIWCYNGMIFWCGSTPIFVNFSGRNIHLNHLPAILGCTRYQGYQGFDPDPYGSIGFRSQRDDKPNFFWVQKGTSIYDHQFQRGTLLELTDFIDLAVCQNLVPLVNIKIAGKWMFIPLKMVLIDIDPYPFHYFGT